MLQFSQSVCQNLHLLIHNINKSLHLLFAIDDANALRVRIVSDAEFPRYCLGKFPKINKHLSLISFCICPFLMTLFPLEVINAYCGHIVRLRRSVKDIVNIAHNVRKMKMSRDNLSA